MNYKEKWQLHFPYGMFEVSNDDGTKAFVVINYERIYDNKNEAWAEVARLNAEWRKKQEK